MHAAIRTIETALLIKRLPWLTPARGRRFRSVGFVLTIMWFTETRFVRRERAMSDVGYNGAPLLPGPRFLHTSPANPAVCGNPAKQFGKFPLGGV
jgi:hypothetical protein